MNYTDPYKMELIHDKELYGNYLFQPVRRTEIPKEGTSKTRKLGTPVVMERIVGTCMHVVLGEYFDPKFTDSSFGIRKGRSLHQATRHRRALLNERKKRVASGYRLESVFSTNFHMV